MTRTPFSSPVEPATLTLAELAKCLHIGRTKAYELARRNELPVPALRVGQEFRFSRVALEQWLEGEWTHDAF